MTASTRPTQRIALMLQGGGALGAYQAGVFEAMDRSGIHPDWIVGTSIGAINGAIIAGNRPQRRLEHLHEFWSRVGKDWSNMKLDSPTTEPAAVSFMSHWNALVTMALGVNGFFSPRWGSGFAFGMPVIPRDAAHYDVAPLARTLEELIDFDYLAQSPVRLSLGAVDIQSGKNRYFDSRTESISVHHILASSALPPAFGPIEIDGRHYWDGGISSNTPLEYVLREDRCSDMLCFLATLWPAQDGLPDSLHGVMRRRKEIQFSSKVETLLELEREIQQLRRDISFLAGKLPAATLDDGKIQAAIQRGCQRVCHLVRLQVPRLAGEDGMKDIDFAPSRVGTRWTAGRRDAATAIAWEPWRHDADPSQGLVLHEYCGLPDSVGGVTQANTSGRPTRRGTAGAKL